MEGDKTHLRLTNFLSREGERVSVEEIKRVGGVLEKDDHVVDFGDIISGDIFANKSEPNRPYVTLEDGLRDSLQTKTGVLFRYLDYTVAISQMAEQVVLFDPHARNDCGFVDGNGVAQLISFPSIPDIVQYFCQFVLCNGVHGASPQTIESLSDAQRSFDILPVSVVSLKVSC